MKIHVPFTVHRAGDATDSLVSLSAYKQKQFKDCPTSTKPDHTITRFGYWHEASWIPNVTQPQTNEQILAVRTPWVPSVPTVQTEQVAAD
jgi:hypothetical protein